MSGRGTITRRAVFSSRLSTFSIIIRSLRDRWPPATLSATISRSSSSLWASSAVLVWPRPSTQSVRLLALFKSQITGEKTYDRITSGRSRQEHQDLGARIARLLGACSPSAMCRKVTSESAAIGHGRDRDAEDRDRGRADAEASERRLAPAARPSRASPAPAPGWRP